MVNGVEIVNEETSILRTLLQEQNELYYANSMMIKAVVECKKWEQLEKL